MKFRYIIILCLLACLSFNSCEELANTTNYEEFNLENDQTYYFTFGLDLDLFTENGTVLNASCFSYPAGLYSLETESTIAGQLLIENGIITLDDTPGSEGWVTYLDLDSGGTEPVEVEAQEIIFGSNNSTPASNYTFTMNGNETVKMTSKSSAVCDVVLTGGILIL